MQLCRVLALVAIGVSAVPSTSIAQCPSWQSGFQLPGLNGNARALLSHDDGSGRKLYVGGNFRGAGRVPARSLARWTGVTWETFGGGGVDNYVEDLAEFDDGSGKALYVCGPFSTVGGVAIPELARWDGVAWSSVGGSVHGAVRAIEVFDDGTGPALYAAGNFSAVGGVPAASIARWDGTAWTPLGSGIVYPNVSCLAVFDDGNGPALYAGGGFHTAGGVPVSNVARWRNGAWSAVGTWNSHFKVLCAHDDGSGPKLYAGGTFYGGVIRFENGAWSPVGGGVSGSFGDVNVSALASFDDGNGPKLYASGVMIEAGGLPVRNFARWDGSAWSQAGDGGDAGTSSSGGLEVGFGTFDDGLGGGESLYVGLGAHGAVSSCGISRWTGSRLAPLSGGAVPYATIGAGGGGGFATFDEGSGEGEELYVFGNFDYLGSVHSPYIARWNGWRWRPFGGLSWGENQIGSLAVHDDGSGPALHAWRGFLVGTTTTWTWRVMRWGQGQWTPLHATGFAGGVGDAVAELASLDVGGVRALYATGTFDSVDGVPAKNIASYANGAWQALGAGLTGQSSVGSALISFDNGSGPALYVGGNFFRAGATNVNSIARWQAGTWSALGSGLQTASGNRGTVRSFAVYDDGTGPALYVAGVFAQAGGSPATNVACWRNGSWSALGAGIPSTYPIRLHVHDDGTGSALYACGDFTTAGGVPVRHLARWNGVAWAPVGIGTDSAVGFLATYAGGLYVTGAFSEAGGQASTRLARWQSADFRDCDADGVDDACEIAAGTEADLDLDGVPDGCQPESSETLCAGDGSSTPCPCGGPSEHGRGCGNSLFARGATLDAFGDASVSADTLRLVGGAMPDSTALYIQGSQLSRSSYGAGTVLGDGLRCVSGSVIRLATKPIVTNGSSYPEPGDASVSVRGLITQVGSKRVYQVWYRNAASFCTPATSNLSNGVALVWQP